MNSLKKEKLTKRFGDEEQETEVVENWLDEVDAEEQRGAEKEQSSGIEQKHFPDSDQPSS